jgi:hypothetical protein
VIAIDDIATLQRREISPGRTLLLVGSIVVVVGAATAAGSVGSSGMAWGGAMQALRLEPRGRRSAPLVVRSRTEV